MEPKGIFELASQHFLYHDWPLIDMWLKRNHNFAACVSRKMAPPSTDAVGEMASRAVLRASDHSSRLCSLPHSHNPSKPCLLNAPHRPYKTVETRRRHCRRGRERVGFLRELERPRSEEIEQMEGGTMEQPFNKKRRLAPKIQDNKLMNEVSG